MIERQVKINLCMQLKKKTNNNNNKKNKKKNQKRVTRNHYEMDVVIHITYYFSDERLK